MKKFLIKLFYALLVVIPFGFMSNANDIIVKEIEEISLDEIGLLNKNNSGLGADMWHGSDSGLLETLIIKMPVDINSNTGNSLKRRLLLTSAIPPKGLSVSLMEVRLKLLALMGDAGNIKELIKLIPKERTDEQMLQIYAASLFISDNYPEACSYIKKLFLDRDTLFWRKALIVCKAFEKKENDVEFSIKFLKEDGHEISSDFESLTRDLIKGDSAIGKEKWENILSKDILKLPEINNPFPDLIQINQKFLPKNKIISWLKEKKELSDSEKLSETANLYAIINSVEVKITESEWQQFILSALSNDIQPPYAAVSELLDILVDGKRKGEAILLILNILGKTRIKDIPPHIFVKIIESLQGLGFEKEAKEMALEGLFPQ